MERIFANSWRGDPCTHPAKFRVRRQGEPARTVCGVHARWYRINDHLYTIEPL